MGRESRENQAARMTVLKSIAGHDNSVVHSFNHTDGRCPMCGCPQQVMMFCSPAEADMPKIRLCELDGRHLHRLCQSCKYPWIERPLDHAMLAQSQGIATAESELAAALAVILERTDGAELDAALVDSRRGWEIQFTRNLERRTLVLTARASAAPQGRPHHPDFPEPGEVQS